MARASRSKASETTSAGPKTPSRETRTLSLTEDAIRQRAFELYLQRGNAPGTPEDDWARAERELRGAPLSPTR